MKRAENAKSFRGSFLLAFLLAAALSTAALWREEGEFLTAARLGWACFVGAIAFLIFYTGRISRWRALFFIVSAWAFVAYFKAFIFGLGNNAFFSPKIQEVPFCHIAIASSFLNALYQQYLAFRSGSWGLWGPLSLGVLWLGVTLAIGQGWCSWACYYGGLDEGFGRVLKKPLFRDFRLPERMRDLPAAVLLVMLFVSLSALLPVFCLWVCPLKVTTAFLDTERATRLIQLAVFSISGALSLVLLPLALKKRVFCGLLCPFGAWQAFWGRINPFRVSIDGDKCTGCGRCLKVCPTFVLNDGTLQNQTVSAYCNRCGECVDACSTGALSYTVWGRSLPVRPGFPGELADVRVFFVMSALGVGGAVGGVYVPDLMSRIFSWLAGAP
ncbi:MAG TPA: 4Fe-4S binding protein [Elusimicrobiota bacterium]|nr:4Fe-4S binding protein [Elusimicrobiota bacterium]